MVVIVILYLYNLCDNHYSYIESIDHEIQYFEIFTIQNIEIFVFSAKCNRFSEI